MTAHCGRLMTSWANFAWTTKPIFLDTSSLCGSSSPNAPSAREHRRKSSALVATDALPVARPESRVHRRFGSRQASVLCSCRVSYELICPEDRVHHCSILAFDQMSVSRFSVQPTSHPSVPGMFGYFPVHTARRADNHSQWPHATHGRGGEGHANPPRRSHLIHPLCAGCAFSQLDDWRRRRLADEQTHQERRCN